MFDNDKSKPLAKELFSTLKDGLQLAASMLLLATILVWFSDEDA